MDSIPRVLLLDDGDLVRIRRMLADFEVELEHLRGEVIREDLEEPRDVVIATVKRILALEGSVDLSELPGKPVWIAVHSQDFLPLRVRLRKLGVHFLVQTSVGSEALRLLLMHSVYRGPERREEPRLPVGSQVECRDAGGSPFAAELLDLACEGCRLLSKHPLQPETALSVGLPSKLAGGEELSLPGRIMRVELYRGSDRKLVTVAFDDLAEEALELLSGILEGKVIGTVVTRLGDDLSEETASTTMVQRPAPEPTQEAASEPAASQDSPPNPRENRRITYTRKVTALLGGGDFAILGRDLSIAGMRSEPLPEFPVGTALELAIYGPSGAEPVLVQAVVARDDGPFGTVFHFESIAGGDRKRLESIIAKGPEIRWLADGEDGEQVVVAHTRVKPPQG
ncbi:MAG: PilZ domain-containing protein [Deltaproteobacteria bacterium]|nr:PilZ domain-containing protein [Deltaproteobacteria bacterium]